LIEKLQKYLSANYPNSDLHAPYSIEGRVHIRFELGDDLKNGTKKRVVQAIARANEIFNRAFTDVNSELWIVFYEYPEEQFNSYEEQRNYIYGLFDKSKRTSLFEDQISIKVGFFETDENGNEFEETTPVKIGIHKLNQKEFDIHGLITGIANLEMGFSPKVPQQVFIFDPITNNGFYMYDDRGCYVWGDNADKIRNIYESLNHWIVDYHRSEIDEYFKV